MMTKTAEARLLRRALATYNAQEEKAQVFVGQPAIANSYVSGRDIYLIRKGHSGQILGHYRVRGDNGRLRTIYSEPQEALKGLVSFMQHSYEAI